MWPQSECGGRFRAQQLAIFNKLYSVQQKTEVEHFYGYYICDMAQHSFSTSSRLRSKASNRNILRKLQEYWE
jgi:hypothetical protein